MGDRSPHGMLETPATRSASACSDRILDGELVGGSAPGSSASKPAGALGKSAMAAAVASSSDCAAGADGM
jgi:hypothetical protein